MAKVLNSHLIKEDIQTANKHMKTRSIRGMQIKTMRYNCTPLRKAKCGTLPIPNTGKQVEKEELSFITGGNGKGDSHFRRDFGIFLQN